VIGRQLLPILAAAAVGLIPFTVFSTFLVDIAATTAVDAPTMGGLRGLGGAAAVAVGAGYALGASWLPVRVATCSGLLALAVGSLVMTVGSFWGVVISCLGIGAATSLLNPALQTAAAERFRSPADQGRAATMVTATTTLTALLAAPVLGGLSLVVGWRGLLGLSAMAAVLLAVILRRAASSRSATDGSGAAGAQRQGRLATIADRATGPLLLISLLRTAAFMGTLAVLAAVYAERHAMTGQAFTWVWSLSGAAFFVANWLTGRALAAQYDRSVTILAAGIVAAIGGLGLVFLSVPLISMLAGSAVLAAGHAMIAAAVTTRLAQVGSPARPAALAMNGLAQSVGTFAGASIAAVGHSVAGWPGTATALGAVTLFCAIPLAVRRRHRASA